MNRAIENSIAYIDSHHEELISFWTELVNFQGSAREPERMARLVKATGERFAREGMAVSLLPTGCDIPMLRIVEGADRSGAPILLCGHLDTVFDSGSYPENPFVIRDGTAYGPGVLDMKGGVAMILTMVKALRAAEFDRHPIKILLCGDEETIHSGSNVPKLIRQESEGCFFALNMESGRMDNCLSTGRKGSFDCYVTVHGKAGHVGNDFPNTSNAIEEMAHKIIALQALTRYDDGIVVSVDTIKGGTVSNAVPDLCRVEIDARFTHSSDIPAVKKQIKKVCETCHVEGTRTEVKFGPEMPVFEESEGNLALLAHINRTAADLGFAPFGKVFPGGCSDVSYIAMAGIPAVCSCGVMGSGAHTMEERAIVSNAFERAKILTAAILSIEDSVFPER